VHSNAKVGINIDKYPPCNKYPPCTRNLQPVDI